MATVGEVLQQARQLVAAGRWHEAAEVYSELVRLVPQAGEFWAELGFVRLKTNEAEAAIACFEKAVELAPHEAAFLANLGTAYRAAHRNDLAIVSYERAMQLGGPTPQLYSNLALALKAVGKTDAALQALDSSIQLDRKYVNGLLNRGNLLRELGHLDDASVDYRRLLELEPHDVGARVSLGMVYYDQGALDAALAEYDRALEIQPDYAEAHRNRAVIWLSRGDYVRGWPEYEWRLKCTETPSRDLPQPLWDGSPLGDRSLMVCCEQGLGDTLQFVRYLPLASAQGGTVWIDVPAPLAPLLVQSGFGKYLADGSAPPRFDVHCALLSLPATLPGRVQPFWSGPYLVADPRRVARWKEPLDRIDGFTVGIAWAGNPRHPHDRYRSTQLEHFASLAAIDGVRLISLHRRDKDSPATDREFELIDVGIDADVSSGAFMDTAAVMQHLDLVITVDTAIAHVAGGLGVRTWLALDYSPDWRWLTTGETTAWYPTTQLFRQPKLGDWTSVFSSMAAQLQQFVRSKA